MIKLPKLPYDLDALAPNISERTMSVHYEKHHAGYVKKLNDAFAGAKLSGISLETIIRSTNDTGIFNNAAQVWNHTFYWHSMTPETTKPSGALRKALEAKFGSLAKFEDAFAKAAGGQFGSGWAWLVANRDNKLSIKTTSNAKTPVTSNSRPLLVCDVWEHAYYLDYQNKRGAYVKKFMELINWKFASKNFAAKGVRRFKSL